MGDAVGEDSGTGVGGGDEFDAVDDDWIIDDLKGGMDEDGVGLGGGKRVKDGFVKEMGKLRNSGLLRALMKLSYSEHYKGSAAIPTRVDADGK